MGTWAVAAMDLVEKSATIPLSRNQDEIEHTACILGWEQVSGSRSHHWPQPPLLFLRLGLILGQD